MDIPSVLFCFLEVALKCRLTATVVEIKQIMLVKLKTHMTVHDGGRTMIGNRIFNFRFTVMQESDLQRITLFLAFNPNKAALFESSFF